MMEKGPLAELLVERYESMPPQLKIAASFVLDHPRDVALMSMREQASQAGVSHTTMMRLARWLGLDGYEDMRSLYAKALRDPGFSSGDSAWLDRRQAGDSGYATAGVVADALAAQTARLGEFSTATQLIAAAGLLAEGRQIFSLGLRGEYAVAQHFAATLSGIGKRIILVEDNRGFAMDVLRDAGPDDVLLAIGLAPYGRATVEIAQKAAARGVRVIAITDSSVSPLARLAQESVLVTSSSQSFFKSIAPALAATEILCALVGAREPADANQVARDFERELEQLDVFWKPHR